MSSKIIPPKPLKYHLLKNVDSILDFKLICKLVIPLLLSVVIIVIVIIIKVIINTTTVANAPLVKLQPIRAEFLVC